MHFENKTSSSSTREKLVALQPPPILLLHFLSFPLALPPLTPLPNHLPRPLDCAPKYWRGRHEIEEMGNVIKELTFSVFRFGSYKIITKFE